jgi:hypothetical protein
VGDAETWSERSAAKPRSRGKRWEIGREGAQHTVYKLAGLTIPIPRHNEVGEGLAREIFKECEPVLGRGWTPTTPRSNVTDGSG